VIHKHQIQLLELQARLASALGQLREVIKCTICGVPITGPSQREHQVDCPLARDLNVSPIKPGRTDETSMDFSFGSAPAKQKSAPVTKAKSSRKHKSTTKRIVNKTGDQFRDANGKFDRHAWATDKAAKRKAEGKTLFGGKKKAAKQTEQLGIPAGIGGLD
jgi:hypothetical protein